MSGPRSILGQGLFQRKKKKGSNKNEYTEIRMWLTNDNIGSDEKEKKKKKRKKCHTNW